MHAARSFSTQTRTPLTPSIGTLPELPARREGHMRVRAAVVTCTILLGCGRARDPGGGGTAVSSAATTPAPATPAASPTGGTAPSTSAPQSTPTAPPDSTPAPPDATTPPPAPPDNTATPAPPPPAATPRASAGTPVLP